MRESNLLPESLYLLSSNNVIFTCTHSNFVHLSQIEIVLSVKQAVITQQTPELELRRPQDTPVSINVSVLSKGSRAIFYSWYKDGVLLLLM